MAAKRKSGPSGHSKSNEERRADGRTRVSMWLDPGELGQLAALCGKRQCAAAVLIRQLLREEWERV